MRPGLLSALIVLSTACSSVTPLPVQTGEFCFRCRRPIADTRYAAEIVDSSWQAYKFRTPGCMAQYLREREPAVRGMFVTDYSSGRLIGAERASFVQTVIDERTREMDYVAFRSGEAARAFAGSGQVVDWMHVLGALAQVNTSD